MTPDQILQLVQIVIQFVEWFAEHRKNKKLGPIRRAWLEKEYNNIRNNLSALSLQQQQEIAPQLKHIQDLLAESDE